MSGKKAETKVLTYSQPNLLQLADVLRNGGIGIFPTDTIYDIGCSVKKPDALKRIFALKARSLNQSLSILISRPEVALEIADFREKDMEILKKVWPGPWTLITKARAPLPAGAVGPDGTVALRCPDHGIALELLRQVGDTLAVSSANFSGAKSPARFDEIDPEVLEQVDCALDAGVCPLGGETAIARFENKKPRIIRTGCVSKDEVARIEGILSQINRD